MVSLFLSFPFDMSMGEAYLLNTCQTTRATMLGMTLHESPCGLPIPGDGPI